MKIAVTSKKGQLSSDVDLRFGRAAYILIVDSETLEFEAVDNSANGNAFKGAGIKAATMIADKGVEILLTGHCGPNAFKTVSAAGIKVVNNISGTVSGTVEKFKMGGSEYSTEVDVEGQS